MNTRPFQKNEIHQNLDFHLTIYPCQLSDTFNIGAHFHDHFEILYVTNGTATIYIGKETFLAQKNDIFFSNMYQVHSAIVESGNTATIQAIVFHRDILDSINIHDYYIRYISPFLSGEKQFPSVLNSGNTLYKVTKDALDIILYENEVKSIGYEVFIKTEIERLFANFFRYKSSLEIQTARQISTNNRELLNNVVSYIEKHFASSITLEEISKHVSMNKSYFCRLIKKLTGRSVTEFLNIYRIKQAEILLKKTSYPISLVSQKVGFTNHSYFNRIFKQCTGITPLKFRKQ